VVLDQAKAEFARAIGAQAADIAVMSCVSDLASSVAHCLDFGGERRRVVLGDIDFPSLGHVWLAQQARGADIHFVPGDAQGCIALEAYEAAIDGRTRLVSVSHVSYANGFLQDIAAIGRLAHDQGALLLVDAYQSAGAMVIDVLRDDIDILVCGAQKFLLGCPGIAFMYVRPGLAAELRPATTGWFGRVNPFAFDIRTLDYADGARRFDTGTPPYINAFAAQAGMALLNGLGLARIEAWLQHLSALAVAEAERLGLPLASPRDPARKGATTAIRVPDSPTVERRMAEAGYVVSARGPMIRIAPHFYNTEDEVAGALAALARLA
ncbi:MAG: aminotransferase class V-fold PLP-dependent enzyme, partial [Rhodoferax sp.]|nr:aminotransferase class V-fold PLP-dependent enzyme [Rhodoferax sp.]